VCEVILKFALISSFLKFPSGERPIPSCLGGGDLDGDLYNLIPLSDPDYKDLHSFKPEQLFPPASYEAAERQTLDRPSTMRDVAEFFMEYISSDVRHHFRMVHCYHS
jgi:RNA-dependent RNA polymerase